MIIDEPYARHLNEVSRFPQVYVGGKKRKSKRKTLGRKRKSLKSKKKCKKCKTRSCRVKYCKRCKK